MSLPPGVPLSEIPAGQPPIGITPNFVDPPSLAPALIAVSAIMMLWALSFTGLRLYANLRASRGLEIDDYFCMTGTVLAIGYTSMVLSLTNVARHTYDIPLSYFDEAYLKRSYAQGMLLGPTLFFAKSAIFLLYLRIFIVNKNIKHSIWFGLAFTSVLYWINIPFESWYCAPRAGDPWDLETVGKTCPHNIIFGMVQGILAVVLDLYIFIIPIPVVLNLQMSMKRRLSVIAVFATAFLGITAAVVAMVYRIKLYKATDKTWATASLFICVTCENYVAIIVSSMPALASLSRGKFLDSPWLDSIRSRFLLWASHSKSNNSYESTMRASPSDEVNIAGPHARDNGYLEIDDSTHVQKYELGLVSTQIPEATSTRRYPE